MIIDFFLVLSLYLFNNIKRSGVNCSLFFSTDRYMARGIKDIKNSEGPSPQITTMARVLGVGEVPLFTTRDIADMLTGDMQPTFPDHYTTWVIPNTTTLVQLMKKTRGEGIAIAMNGREDLIPGNQAFESGSGKFTNPACMYLLQSNFSFDEHIFQNVFIAMGDKVAIRGFVDIAEQSENIRVTIGKVETVAAVPDVPQTTVLTTITTSVLYGYNSTELGLFTVLTSPTESRETKIISTCVFLFPYIRPLISDYITILDYHEPDIAHETRGIAIGQGIGGTLSGEQLGLLAIFVLGPAYLLDTKLNEQTARRVKAAAASMQLATLSPQDMAGLINRVNWRAGDINPIIDDVLSSVICIKEDMTSDPEVQVGHLASGIWLKQQKGLTDIGVELLEQARLVYKNYHATSISFIPVVIPQIKQTLGEENPTLNQETASLNQILEIVNNCPYMGLRSKLPEKFHIKNFPKLVYCALKYHEASLSDPTDASSFKLYKVGEIKNHITSLAAFAPLPPEFNPEINDNGNIPAIPAGAESDEEELESAGSDNSSDSSDAFTIIIDLNNRTDGIPLGLLRAWECNAEIRRSPLMLNQQIQDCAIAEPSQDPRIIPGVLYPKLLTGHSR